MLTAYGTRPQYWRHLEPIVLELERRGHDVARVRTAGRVRKGRVLVASAADAARFTNHEVIYAEHGAGQTYIEGEPFGYAGSPRLARVVLFLCPNERVELAWRAAYPQAAVRTVGSPVLDAHHRRSSPDTDARSGQSSTAESTAIVAVTCHWECGVCPETMPALPYFMAAVEYLARDHEVIGHAHPRIARRMEAAWGEIGIRYVADPDRVLERASVLVADNTSLMYEAAAIDLPVVALNAPSYRRNIEHGLRFWSHVPGQQVDHPHELRPAVDRALRDPRELQRLRHRAARYAYAALDGHAAERAADAIEELTDGPMGS